MALPSPTSQPAYPHQQGPLIPSSVFSSDRELQELVNRRDMRISSTHDLAEFLRSSRPEDYSRHPAKVTDDLAVDAGHRKISFKYLKTASKDLLSHRKNSISVPVPSTLALPEKVRPEKTSKGNSYLAIQIDYTPGRNSEVTIPSPRTPGPNEGIGKDCVRKTTPAGFPSDRSHHHNNFISQAWKDHDSAFLSDYDGAATADAQAMTGWMRNSSGSELSSSQTALFVSPLTAPHPSASYSIKVPKQRVNSATSYASITSDYSKSSQPARFSVVPKPGPDLSAIQRRHSSDSTLRVVSSARVARFSSPVRKDDLYIPISSTQISSTAEDGACASVNITTDNQSVSSTPTQPGPPPTRELPSLPEGHGDAMNLASKIRAAAATRSSIGSQLSLTSEIGSLKNRRQATLSRTRSEREISVKAKKIKDLEDLKSKRGVANSGVSHNPDCSSVKPKRNQGKARRQAKTDIVTFSMSPITVVYEVSPGLPTRLRSHYSGETTPRDSSSLSRSSSEALPQRVDQAIDLPGYTDVVSETGKSAASSQIHRSTNQDIITSLEDRVQRLEQRNFRLEQALFAVLRGNISVGTGSSIEGPSLSEILVTPDPGSARTS